MRNCIFGVVETKTDNTMRFPKHVMDKIQSNPELKKRFEKEEKKRAAAASKKETEEKGSGSK